MSSPYLSSRLTTANMSAMDRVLAKAGVYQLRAIEDLPVVVSATKFLIGRILQARVGEAGLLFALLNRTDAAAIVSPPEASDDQTPSKSRGKQW